MENYSCTALGVGGGVLACAPSAISVAMAREYVEYVAGESRGVIPARLPRSVASADAVQRYKGCATCHDRTRWDTVRAPPPAHLICLVMETHLVLCGFGQFFLATGAHCNQIEFFHTRINFWQ